MKQIFNWKAGLIVIVLLASFLRLWQLGEIPSGIHADEADTGYSAYSILKTGKTQYADFNPLMFTEENGGSQDDIEALRDRLLMKGRCCHRIFQTKYGI